MAQSQHSLCRQAILFFALFLNLTLPLQALAIQSSYHYEVGSDPLFKKQTALQYAHLDEAMNLLLDEKTLAAEPVLVGVIDEGPVNRIHPDLEGVVLPESETDSTNASQWHAQYVTGILAARTGNHIGIRGAIGLQARVIYRQVRSADDIIYSLNKLVARGVAVINMSLGLDAPCSTTISFEQRKCQEPILASPRIASAIQKVLNGSKTVLVISAGNDQQKVQPFAAERDAVIVVGSMNKSGNVASYSNYGPGISLFAPDFGVVGLTATGYTQHEPATSFSTPLVSAAAAWSALYLKAHGTRYSAHDIKKLLLGSVRPQIGLLGKGEVAGSLDYLNLAHALQTFVQTRGSAPGLRSKKPTKHL